MIVQPCFTAHFITDFVSYVATHAVTPAATHAATPRMLVYCPCKAEDNARQIADNEADKYKLINKDRRTSFCCPTLAFCCTDLGRFTRRAMPRHYVEPTTINRSIIRRVSSFGQGSFSTLFLGDMRRTEGVYLLWHAQRISEIKPKIIQRFKESKSKKLEKERRKKRKKKIHSIAPKTQNMAITRSMKEVVCFSSTVCPILYLVIWPPIGLS